MSQQHLVHINKGCWFWHNENTLLHKDLGPAYIGEDGTFIWAQNGYFHRENGPAIIWWDKSREWWQNGVRIMYDTHDVPISTLGDFQDMIFMFNDEEIRNYIDYFDDYEIKVAKTFRWVKNKHV